MTKHNMLCFVVINNVVFNLSCVSVDHVCSLAPELQFSAEKNKICCNFMKKYFKSVFQRIITDNSKK